MINKIPFRKIAYEFLVDTAGCLIFAIAFNWLFQPNQIVVGGFTGIAQIVNHYFDFIPVGVFSIIINIPLFLIAIRVQGLKILLTSLYCMIVGSVFIDVINSIYTFHPMSSTLVAAIFGGVLLGVSMGMLLTVGSTTGGTELLARVLKYRWKTISIGKLCMFIDCLVVIAYAITFKSVDTALYGTIAMYISGMSMDAVVYGGMGAKMAYIISPKHEEIRQKLIDLDLGVTMLDGKGGMTGNRTEVVMCAFRKQKIVMIKETVMGIDKDAFMIVCDAHEVLGEGFGVYDKNSL